MESDPLIELAKLLKIKVEFFDIKTGKKPRYLERGMCRETHRRKKSDNKKPELFIGPDGSVYQYIYQSYANFAAMMIREDVGYRILEK